MVSCALRYPVHYCSVQQLDEIRHNEKLVKPCPIFAPSESISCACLVRVVSTNRPQVLRSATDRPMSCAALRCKARAVPQRQRCTAVTAFVLPGTSATVQYACSLRRLQILGCAAGQKIMVEAQQWVAAHHPYVKAPRISVYSAPRDMLCADCCFISAEPSLQHSCQGCSGLPGSDA